MNEYTETIHLDINADDSLKKLKESFADINDNILKDIKKQYSLEEDRLDQIKKLRSEIELLRVAHENDKVKELESELKKLSSEQEEFEKLKSGQTDEEDKSDKELRTNTFKNFKEGFTEAFDEFKQNSKDFNQLGKDVFNQIHDIVKEKLVEIVRNVKQFISDVLDKIEEMASWDITSSRTYNRNAIDLYKETGLVGSQAYGLSQALQKFGFSSYDDYLQALPTMNKNQQEYFTELMKQNSKQYEESIELSSAIENYQNTFDDFKREMQNEVIKFIAENKDEIMNCLKVGVECLKILANVVSGIVSLFSSGSERSSNERKQATTEILTSKSSKNYTTNNNQNTNIKIDNTYNGVGKTDQIWLANTGQMTYQQIIQAFKII